MTTGNLGGILIRILAILMVWEALLLTVQDVTLWVTAWGDYVALAMSAGAVALIFVVAVVLWKYSGALGQALASRSAHDEVQISMTATELEVAGFGLLGVWLAITAIPDLLGGLLWIYHDQSAGAPFRFSAGIFRVGPSLLQLALGAGLAVGRQGLKRALDEGRTWGA